VVFAGKRGGGVSGREGCCASVCEAAGAVGVGQCFLESGCQERGAVCEEEEEQSASMMATAAAW
jgi:hypothetical protein